MIFKDDCAFWSPPATGVNGWGNYNCSVLYRVKSNLISVFDLVSWKGSLVAADLVVSAVGLLQLVLLSCSPLPTKTACLLTNAMWRHAVVEDYQLWVNPFATSDTLD